LQEEKWVPGRRAEILRRHLQLTQKAAEQGARFILWPESSTLEQIATSADLRHQLQDLADRYKTVLVVGSVHQVEGGAYTNAAFMLLPHRGLVDRYDKVRLVPFGERVPFPSILFFIKPLVEAVGSFVPGKDLRPLGLRLPPPAGQAWPPPVGVVICYELAYPGLVAAEVRGGATFLATITNDAWFGESSAPYQHFAMAAVRAVETRRWLLRAANTGISGLISPRGEVVASTSLFQSALVEGRIIPHHDLTLAVRWPWAMPAACVMFLAAALAWSGLAGQQEFHRLFHSGGRISHAA
ncbi:MAG: apolipoprotein N-acyltransferase, partial [Acidobacteriota bacterium]